MHHTWNSHSPAAATANTSSLDCQWSASRVTPVRTAKRPTNTDSAQELYSKESCYSKKMYSPTAIVPTSIRHTELGYSIN